MVNRKNLTHLLNVPPFGRIFGKEIDELLHLIEGLVLLVHPLADARVAQVTRFVRLHLRDLR